MYIMTITYRRATSNDIPQLKAINEQCLPENYPLQVWKFMMELDLASYVAMDDDKIVGYDVVTSPSWLFGGDPCVLIISLAVLEEYRRKGIATELLKRSIELVGDQEIQLNVRESNPAKKLYEKFGFKVKCIEKEYYINPVETGLLMSNSVNDQ